ncbi:hypothetical protein L3Q82_015204 [Scortum barcoo]|uniref:Uncharacterized protein n=1 Tax=Scortum barcoo TaxID=214431 RepID=A0ACB8VTP4_9TELE|nr:hypothetical protein L3Q82_015204 [Scortum barcoo]
MSSSRRRDSLAPLVISPGTVLSWYVDDLLTASPTREQCEGDTVTLLKHLADEGHKASLSKLQFVQEKVTFFRSRYFGTGEDFVSKASSDNRWQLPCLLLPPSPCTPCNLGDFVMVKDFRRNHWQAKRWHGPFPDPPHHSHGCESGRTSDLDPCQPLQKGTSTCRITTDHDTNTLVTSIDSQDPTQQLSVSRAPLLLLR